jgi:hypothetical protein
LPHAKQVNQAEQSDPVLCVVVLQFRAERGVAPAYAEVMAARHGVMKSALQRRQVGAWSAASDMVSGSEAAAAG